MKNQNLNIDETIKAWAEITIKEWVKKAAFHKVHRESPISSARFIHHIVSSANGSAERINFMFDYYLKFVNWGVGNSVTISDRDVMILPGKTKRRPKPWYDDVFYKQLKILSHLMTEKYSRKVTVLVKTTLEESIKFNFTSGEFFCLLCYSVI